jgi:hypothetical protein
VSSHFSVTAGRLRGDLLEDISGGYGPDERFWIDVAMFELIADRGLEFVDAPEDAATDTLLDDRSEAVLDLVALRS